MRADLHPSTGGAAVKADARPGCGTVSLDHPGVGPEGICRILGGDAALQGGTTDTQLVLTDSDLVEGLPRCDPQLRLHQVNVGDFLRDGVFHLDTGVHLDEHVATGPRPRGLDEELDGPGAGVVDGLGEFHGIGCQCRTQLVADMRSGGDLHHLLVAALNGTVAFEEMNDVALAVGQHLHLDVTGSRNCLLHEHRRVAERSFGLAHRGPQLLGETSGVVDTPHTAATTAGDCLDEHREADLLGTGDQLLGVGGRRCRPEGRHPRPAGLFEGPHLVAGQFEHLGGGADEGDLVSGTGRGQVWVLREETVAGIDRIGPGLLRYADDLLDIKVSLDRMIPFSDQIGLGGLDPVVGVAILIGKDGNGLTPQFEGSADGSNSDLASVGDKDLLEHAPRLVAKRDSGSGLLGLSFLCAGCGEPVKTPAEEAEKQTGSHHEGRDPESHDRGEQGCAHKVSGLHHGAGLLEFLRGGGVTRVLGLLDLGTKFGIRQAVARRTGVLFDRLGLIKGGEGARHLRSRKGRGVGGNGNVFGCELGGGDPPGERPGDKHDNPCYEGHEAGNPG